MPNKRTGQDYLEYRKNPEPTRPKLERRKSTPKKKFNYEDEYQRSKKMKEDHWNSLSKETQEYITKKNKEEKAKKKNAGGPTRLKAVRVDAPKKERTKLVAKRKGK